MPIRGERTILSFGPLLREAPVAGATWFDAHTHMGQCDPDGVKGTPEEILQGLQDAGHAHALLFAMHEPDGYAGPNAGSEPSQRSKWSITCSGWTSR
jgi:hypothetical protein